MGAGELERLDDRLRELSETMLAKMASMETCLQIVEGQVSMMNKALFQGNGRPSMATRLEVMEQAQAGFAAQCKECKAVIIAGTAKREEDKKEATKEVAAQKTMITVEKWKAIAAIVTALLASPVLIAIVVAIFK